MYQSIYSFQWTFSTLWTVMQVVALCKCSKQKPRKCTACRLRTIIRMLARVHHLSHTHTHSHTHTDTYASSAWAMYTVEPRYSSHTRDLQKWLDLRETSLYQLVLRRRAYGTPFVTIFRAVICAFLSVICTFISTKVPFLEMYFSKHSEMTPS